jgi:hypothetical protein
MVLNNEHFAAINKLNRNKANMHFYALSCMPHQECTNSLVMRIGKNVIERVKVFTEELGRRYFGREMLFFLREISETVSH